MLATAELHRLAQGGATLLAPNLRSARQIRTQLHSVSGGSYLPAEYVVHWRGWTANLWQQILLQGRDDRVLLQPEQERLLWAQVLERDADVEPTDALLDLCRATATLVHRYDAQGAVLAHAASATRADTARFARWFATVNRRCTEERLLPSAALEAALSAEAVRRPLTGAPEMLALCALHDLSPSQQSLLQACGSRETRLEEVPDEPDRMAVPPALIRCADDRDELHTLAGHLENALRGATRPRIAVIVPDLSTARDRLDRELRERLGRAGDEALQQERQPLWEFSTGRSLASYAVVATALTLLEWTVREISTAELSSLVRSPYLQWPVSPDHAAALDAGGLRRHPTLRATWSPSQAAHVLERESPQLSQVIVAQTGQWPAWQHDTASYSSFAERSRHLLRDWGWPGRRSQNSLEFQAVRRWQTALDSLAALDLVGPPTAWSDFVLRLQGLVRKTVFAPENTNAPIQFLTPEESTGIQAEEVWFAHADEGRWNSDRHTSPLLTRSLQLRYGMPGADPLQDADRFSRQMERTLAIAPQTTFSYAHTGEAGDQRASTAVTCIPDLQRRESDTGGVLERVHAASPLQPFSDERLPLPDDGAQVLRGGVDILKNQAACAFRAFAEGRMASRAIEDHDLGMDPSDRGSLVHKALHLFWDRTADRTALLSLMQAGRLEQAILRAVHDAAAVHMRGSDRWTQEYLSIQQERMVRVLGIWLRGESERPNFRPVALEKEVQVRVGPLQLRVRVDRVDAVGPEPGAERLVIIDYKTGDAKEQQWIGDRPEEPQLPLYATAAALDAAGAISEPIGAIAFGVVRAGHETADKRFRSMPPRTALLAAQPDTPDTSMEATLDAWRSILETLADDFASGIATVAPRDYPSTCKFCSQRLLCRLNPDAAASVRDDEDEA